MRLAQRNRWSAAPFSVGWRDASLSVLLVIQVLITFIVVPLLAMHSDAEWILERGNLAFAAVCAVALTRRRSVRTTFLVVIAAVALIPGPWLHDAGFAAGAGHRLAAIVAFTFNLILTVLVAGGAFSEGEVTGHRILGAVLVYLNVAVLFAIAFDVLYVTFPGAFQFSSGTDIASGVAARLSDLSYFSLTTVTATGFGDILAVHPLARSLASAEAVFGQLFPAIFLSRLVSLNLVRKARRATGGPAG